MTRPAIHCEHANEVPYTCPCDAECYCKEHTCRSRVSNPPGRVTRNMSTPESRAFWEGCEERAREVAEWPCWKRGVACPGRCCKCTPLSSWLQVLCLNLTQAGYCARYVKMKPVTRFTLLEIDP